MEMSTKVAGDDVFISPLYKNDSSSTSCDSSPEIGTVSRPRFTSFDGTISTLRSDDIFHVQGIPPGAVFLRAASKSAKRAQTAPTTNGVYTFKQSETKLIQPGKLTPMKGAGRRHSGRVRTPGSSRINDQGSPIMPGEANMEGFSSLQRCTLPSFFLLRLLIC